MTARPEIILIAAIGRNRELGAQNRLLWDLPDDLNHFRRQTAGFPVIMGRKTFDSIGKPLPGRQNIVVSRNPKFAPEGVTCATSLEQAIALADPKPQKIFVIGGEQLYRLALPIADRLIITEVDGGFPEAETFFPVIDREEWEAFTRERHAADARHAFAYSITEYHRLEMRGV